MSPIKSKSADSSRSDKSLCSPRIDKSFNFARTKSTDSPRTDKSSHSSRPESSLTSSKASKSVHSSRSYSSGTRKSSRSSQSNKSAGSSKSDKSATSQSADKSHKSSHLSRADRSIESDTECIYISNSSEDSPIKKHLSQENGVKNKPETSSKQKLKLKSLKMDGSLDKWMNKMKENKHISTSSNVSTDVLSMNVNIHSTILFYFLIFVLSG